MTNIGLNSAATGMAAQTLKIGIIANNLSNSGTTAFKANMAAFQDLSYSKHDKLGSNNSGDSNSVPTSVQVGTGVRTGAVYRINTQGELKNTDNPLDLAIDGRGYFKILTASGDYAYTRAGNFTKDNAGQIVTTDGYIVEPAITIPQDAVELSISNNGKVQAKQPGSKDQPFVWNTIGQIELVNFNNENGLEGIGGNLFIKTEASGDAITGVAGLEGFGSIKQYWVEASNVDPVKEITELISAQRGFEMCSKVITAIDEMMQTANSAKR
jgi:flagellar basal-body rod protein FlgG